MDNEIITIPQLCKELHISPTTAYKLTTTKELKSAKIGKERIIRRKDLEIFLEKKINE